MEARAKPRIAVNREFRRQVAQLGEAGTLLSDSTFPFVSDDRRPIEKPDVRWMRIHLKHP